MNLRLDSGKMNLLLVMKSLVRVNSQNIMGVHFTSPTALKNSVLFLNGLGGTWQTKSIKSTTVT